MNSKLVALAQLAHVSWRGVFVGVIGLTGLTCVLIASTGSIIACDSISDTSPLPDGDASDLDVGAVPTLEDSGTAPTTSTVDTGAPPASARVRLAHLLQKVPGAGAVDLCAKRDEATGVWEAQKITLHPTAPKAAGLLPGEVSTHIFLPVLVAGAAGTKYFSRVVPLGTPCEGDGGAPLVSIASTTLRQGGGATLIAVGVVGEGGDSGTPDAAPKGVVIPDVLTPSAASSSIRLFHGVPNLPPLDMIIGSETIVTGVKYGTAFGFPYSTTTGFATVAGGVAEGSTLTLKAGTTAKSFNVPARIRRGVAMTIFSSGRLDDASNPLTVTLCADRSPAETETLATCTKLAPE